MLIIILHHLKDLYCATPLSLGINALNTCIFIAGIVFLVKSIGYLRRNMKELRNFEKIANSGNVVLDKQGIIDTLGDPSKFSKKGILATIILSIRKLSETSLEDKDILVHLEDVSNEIRTAVPKAVPGIGVTLGFLGTVIGLFLAIYELPQMFTAGSGAGAGAEEGLQRLTMSMVGAIKGMRTAYGSTIVGLSSAVILTLANLGYRVWWERYDHLLKRVTTLWIYPAFSVAEKDNIVNHLVRLMEASGKTLSTIEVSNSRLLNSMNGLSDNMAAYNRENEKIIRQVSTVVKEFMASQQGSKKAFEAMQKIGVQTQQSYQRIEGLLDSALQDREAFMAYLQDSRDDIKEISVLQHKAYVETNGEFIKEQERLHAQARDAMMKAFDDFQQYLHGVNEKFVGQNAQLLESTQKAIEAIFERMSKSVGEAGDGFAQRLEQLKEMLESFKAEILENNQRNDSKTQELIGKLGALIEKIRDSFNGYSQG